MAISIRSTLREEDRVFTIAVDRCGADGVEGAVYRGTSQQGWRFSSFLELADIVEQEFRQIRYPGEVMKQRRFLGKGREQTFAAAELAQGERADRCAKAETIYLLRVKQRQNASWQGSLINKKNGQRVAFRSFLEIVRYLESCKPGSGAAEPGTQRANRGSRIIEHYLPFALADSKLGIHTQEIVPGTAVCKLTREGKSNQFLLRLMFFENHACQGVLFWKDKNCKQSFRSFLELIQLLGEADAEGNWEGTMGEAVV